MTYIQLLGAGLLAGALLSAQDNQSENAARMAAGNQPIFRVNVTARTAKAINYQHRSGATKVDFRGTELLPKARGEAKVESKQGYIEIEVEFDSDPAPTKVSRKQLDQKHHHEVLLDTHFLWRDVDLGRLDVFGFLGPW